MKTDATLLAEARQDADAFRQVYERHAARVHGWLLRRCRDADAAHDLTAETFARAWLARRKFHDEAGGSAAPWLLGIARNVLLMSVRRHRLERRGRDRLGLLAERAPAAAAPAETWLDGLDEAVADLPETQRRAVELRVVDELPYDQVAERLGTSPAAARVRVHRALASLRDRLGGAPVVDEKVTP